MLKLEAGTSKSQQQSIFQVSRNLVWEGMFDVIGSYTVCGGGIPSIGSIPGVS